MNTHEKLDSQQFFDAYAAAMLARDAKAIAGLYAVPALVEFPGQAVAVSDSSQTEQFFMASFEQYAAVLEVTPAVRAVAHTGHSRWVEVIWSYDGTPAEQYIYQVIHHRRWLKDRGGDTLDRGELRLGVRERDAGLQQQRHCMLRVDERLGCVEAGGDRRAAVEATAP